MERSPSNLSRLQSLSARGPARGASESQLSVHSADVPITGALTARSTRHAAPQRPLQDSVDSAPLELSKAEAEARQKAKVHAHRHVAALKEREVIQEQIQERRAKQAQARDNKFELMLESLTRDDEMPGKATNHIREHEATRGRKQQELHEKWDSEVAHRVELHLMRYMTHTRPPVKEGLREDLRKGDDPLKFGTRAQQAEEKFHRVARSIIETSPRAVEGPTGRDRQLEAEVAERTRSRVGLPIEHWDQKKHYASRFGYFETAIQGENDQGYHSARRMGTNAHSMDESDGVLAAGKTKTRFEKHKMGMLTGTLAKRGEAAGFKTGHGGGSAAPLQDHYNIERGNEVCDAEFPIGKRSFPQMRLS